MARPNVLLIVVDTLRADHLGFHGYARDTSPNMDRLANDAHVFLNASTSAPWTNPAMLSMFTGLYSSALGDASRAMSLPLDVPSLARVLSAEGYRTHGVVSHLYLSTLFGFNAGFDSWHEKNARGHSYISSAKVTNRALEVLDFLESRAAEATAEEARPFFLLLHYFDPHYDYLEHEGFEFSAGYSGSLTSGRDNIEHLRQEAAAGHYDEQDIQYLHDLYDSEVRFTDHHIGRVLRELERRGLYDETLIVLTADHGEALGNRKDRWVGHTISMHEEVLHVPLVVKLPGDATRIDVERVVGTIDLLPSIADVLRLDRVDSEDWGARSIFRDGGPRPAFSETQNRARLQSVRQQNWKLIHDLESGDP